MEVAEELKKWIASLTTAEKRYVKLIGKARGGTESQQLELFDWLNNNPDDQAIPEEPGFAQNFPTVANRLKDLILDSLHLLHKTENTESRLRTGLDETALLYEKKLYRSASRILRRTKKLAVEFSRYAFVLQCIEWEMKIATMQSAIPDRQMLESLREEEAAFTEKHHALRDLQYRHDVLLSLIRQYFFHRDAGVQQDVDRLSQSEIIRRAIDSGNYIEQALAVDIIGLRSLYYRDPEQSLSRYQELLLRWKDQPEWQQDQTELLLQLCKSYLNICFYSPVDWTEVPRYLAIMTDFTGLKKEDQLHFREIIFQNRFAHALNTGRFDETEALIQEINQWLSDEQALLSDAQVLPFLCNFTVAEFLAGNYASANRYAIRILNWEDRKVRVDIRNFAMVVQAVLQYELGNEGLNEYLTRAGKRHFMKKVSYDINFELIVFRHLEKLLHAGSEKEKQTLFIKLADVLDELAGEIPASVPLLGLNEISMWVFSKKNNLSLREVFLGEVKKNLEALQQAGGHVPERD